MAVYNIIINQGENYDLTATLTDTSGTPINISGYSLRGKVRYSYGSTGVLVDLEPTVVSATGGIINFTLSPSETAALPITVAVYDIERYVSGQAPENTVSRVLQGTVTVTPPAIDIGPADMAFLPVFMVELTSIVASFSV